MAEIWTARLSVADPDVVNVTRKTGLAFLAPSWDILRPMVDIRRMGGTATQGQWQMFADAYLKEMEISLSRNRRAWDELAARPRVVLTCYCTNPARCHRTLLGGFMRDRLGADFRGELTGDETQAETFAMWMGMGDGNDDT